MQICKSKDQRLRAEKGFTLIELSIVIVIIGLIVAGVVGGQALVKQSKLRTLINEINQYQVAVNTFKLEYNHLPGDIPNAYDYWGNSCDSTPSNCNGNGNRKVFPPALDSGSTNVTNDFEGYRNWQHLSLAKLVPQNYTGTSTGGVVGMGYESVAWSKSGKGRITMQHNNNQSIFKSGNVYEVGSFTLEFSGLKPGDGYTPSISVPDARNVDLKIDDGHANTGVFIAKDANCSAAENVVGGADYNTANLNSDVLHCRLHYFLGY